MYYFFFLTRYTYFIFLDNTAILKKTVLSVTPFYYHNTDKFLYDTENLKMHLM